MVKKLRWVFLFATVILAIPSTGAPRQETGPVALIAAAVTYILFRAPRRRVSIWEIPLITLAIAAAGYGAWWFEPLPFITVYTVLATTFGFAATAAGEKRCEQTIRPAWRTFNVPVIGPILPPFAFVYYWFWPRT